MCNLTRLIVIVTHVLLKYLFTYKLYPLALPHLTSHWGKTHFSINICYTTHYIFRFTPLGYNGVKLKVPSSLSGREFMKKMLKNYPYMGQSDVLQTLCHRGFNGILGFAHVASMKGSKSGSNAVRMRVRGFTPRGVKLFAICMNSNKLGVFYML
jgi:hypothetical protein